ncbi:MAG: PAS domain S-box protein [Candidatus Kapaibacterium sp.]
MMGTMIDISEQKDAEERMIAQREFLRNIIDIIPSFIYVKDEYGRYLIVNQKVEEAFNSENKYIIGRKDRDFLDPEFGERFRRQDEEVLRTDRELFIPEEYFVGANNRGYWLQTYKKPITDYTNGKKAVLGVALDNTDRKKAAQELESSERMLKAILKASPIGIALVRNLEVIWTNEAMYSIIGYPVGSFTGKTPHGLFPKADVFENLTQTVREHIEAQGYAQIETELVRADSQKFDALIMIRRIHQDKPEVGNIVAMMDISERKRAEKTYRALVEHSLQGMMILSIMRDYQVLFVNEALCGITSYTSDEMLEFGYDDINDLIFSEDRDEFWKHVNNQIYGIAAPEVFECRIITKYSEVRWVESFILKSRFDREESIQLSFMDISDRKRNEQHKKFALAALVEAEKRKHQTSVLLDNSARIASIGVIAGGITHEINQPLNAIKMGADSIIFWDDNNGKPLPQMVRTLVGHISLATKRIENIITHMRSFWIDKEKLSREPINLNRAVDSAVSLVRQRIHAREIIFNIELHPESLNISANQVQLELIINNLVLNSYHALALVEDRRKKINLRTFRDNSHAVFEVEDNGVGLPDVPPEKLFDPFFSTRKFFEGTGLGLAIVKMFCDRFDAGIKVIPKKQGAIFQVIFDILEEPAENE